MMIAAVDSIVFFKRNPIARVNKDRETIPVPIWRMVFLPNFWSKAIAINAARINPKPSTTGIALAYLGRT